MDGVVVALTRLNGHGVYVDFEDVRIGLQEQMAVGLHAAHLNYRVFNYEFGLMHHREGRKSVMGHQPKQSSDLDDFRRVEAWPAADHEVEGRRRGSLFIQHIGPCGLEPEFAFELAIVSLDQKRRGKFTLSISFRVLVVLRYPPKYSVSRRRRQDDARD